MTSFAETSRHLTDVIEDRKSSETAWLSFEFFPPKTEAGVTSLRKVIAELKAFNPAFVDFTWGAGGSTSTLTFDLCKEAKEVFGLNPNMHLTCTNMEISMIDTALDLCKQHGITNIVSLRGDPPVGQDRWTPKDSQLTCATDLVKYIRSKHGDYFCQSVGGYPEGHPAAMTTLPLSELDSLSETEKTRYSIEDDSINICRDDAFASELAYLKTKIDAGARAIITQMFFDVEVFSSFVASCRQAGILVPIIPGIMCISTYAGFVRMVKFCKTRVPEEVMKKMEALKDDADAVKQYGVEFGVALCRELTRRGAEGLHFYTLNSTQVVLPILEKLGYTKTSQQEDEALLVATA